MFSSKAKQFNECTFYWRNDDSAYEYKKPLQSVDLIDLIYCLWNLKLPKCTFNSRAYFIKPSTERKKKLRKSIVINKNIICIRLFCYFFPFGVERLSSKAGKIPLLYQPKIYFFNYQILYNFCCCKALVIQNCSKKYLWFIWKLSLHWKVKLKFSSLHAPHVLMKLMILMRRITKPPTADRPLTTNPPTGAPPTHRLPTHRQVFHRPTDNQPPTHRPPTHRLTDPITIDQQPFDSPILF